jgi:hypothetical protein
MALIVGQSPVVFEQLNGTDEDDYIDGGTGLNYMVGLGGNDTITGSRLGNTGDFNIAGYSSATASIKAQLGGGTATVTGDASVGTDTLINIDRIEGSIFNDLFVIESSWRGGQYDAFGGGAVGQRIEIRGGGGNDTITGMALPCLTIVTILNQHSGESRLRLVVRFLMRGL